MDQGEVPKERIKRELAEKFYGDILKITNVEEFEKEKKRLDKRALESLIEDTLNGRIEWARELICPREICYIAEASVLNYRDQDIFLPVMFYAEPADDGDPTLRKTIGTFVLCVGNYPTRDVYNDEKVVEAMREVFNIEAFRLHSI